MAWSKEDQEQLEALSKKRAELRAPLLTYLAGLIALESDTIAMAEALVADAEKVRGMLAPFAEAAPVEGSPAAWLNRLAECRGIARGTTPPNVSSESCAVKAVSALYVERDKLATALARCELIADGSHEVALDDPSPVVRAVSQLQATKTGLAAEVAELRSMPRRATIEVEDGFLDPNRRLVWSVSVDPRLPWRRPTDFERIASEHLNCDAPFAVVRYVTPREMEDHCV